MRISLIGAGNTKFHYQEMLGFSEEEFSNKIEEIAKLLADLDLEIVTTPDKGIYFDIAEAYKRKGGKKVYGAAPLSDKIFGIKHLQDFIEEEVNGEKIVDELIDTHDWYKQDVLRCIFGDIILYLGTSLGSLGELSLGYYVYKIASHGKPEVSVPIEKVHEKAVAGKKFPLTTIIYSPFLKDKLPNEIETYVEKAGGKIFYVSDINELKKLLLLVPEKYVFNNFEQT